MPCDTVRSIEVGSLEASDKHLLAKALEALGYTLGYYGQREKDGITVTATGKVEALSYVTDAAPRLAAIKRAYSAEVVSHVAKKYGWAKVDRTNGRIVLTKR